MTSQRDPAAPASPRPASLASARRVDGAAAPDDDFTYAILPQPSASRTAAERRGGTRQRTRLRSGKLIRRDGQFLCECLVNNRSLSGCRLKLPSLPPDMPVDLYFYDDQSELLFQGRVIWHKDRDIGVRLMPCLPSRQHTSIVGAMRRKFYALRR